MYKFFDEVKKLIPWDLTRLIDHSDTPTIWDVLDKSPELSGSALWEIAKSLKEQTDLAKKESRGAAIRSWIAIAISILALILQFIGNLA